MSIHLEKSKGSENRFEICPTCCGNAFSTCRMCGGNGVVSAEVVHDLFEAAARKYAKAKARLVCQKPIIDCDNQPAP
jgi:hypothetical protein